jgi:hypothetical protein
MQIIFLLQILLQIKTTDALYAFKGNTKPTEFVLVVPDDFPASDQTLP